MKVALIMGSISDYKVLRQTQVCLKKYKVPTETYIVSAHRDPKKMFQFAKSAKSKGFNLIIAGAGGAAHLPGMVASLTCLPVIGVPIEGKSLSGLDALLSIVQMPTGIPVATVGINNAENAALLAARILSIKNPKLMIQMEKQMRMQEKKVAAMQKKIKKN